MLREVDKSFRVCSSQLHSAASRVIMSRSEAAPPTTRTLAVNATEQNVEHNFCTNYATTAKYKWWNFIFLNLVEQFRRGANVWFLCISGLQQLPGISPTGRWTTLGPLVLVLAVTAIKEAIEDYQRHKEDARTNNLPVDVVRDGRWQTVKWRDVLVGDVVRVRNGAFIPADLVLLNSSEPQGMCYIETANLDGETNLKIRQALAETLPLTASAEATTRLGGVSIECELPNKRLYNFDGTLRVTEAAGGGRHEYALSPKQLLLRGAALRNTEWAVGAAVFTGHETKLMKNSSNPPLKRSNVERAANKQIFALFVIELCLSALCAIGSTVFIKSDAGSAWYLGLEGDTASAGQTWFLSLLTYIILYNNLIPISLYVSLELAKVGQAYFINKDLRMYYAENDTPALARTSNLNEELGQIQYIFSDKTGTLTRNQMTFRQCTVAGVAYGDAAAGYVCEPSLSSDDPFVQFDDGRLRTLHQKGDKAVCDFVRLLAVCHTVIPERAADGTLTYQANSPDESALVKAAAHLGAVFVARDMKSVKVELSGALTGGGGARVDTYELLNVLEFNSTRKRMSVIVRTADGSIMLFCKGADSVIYERLRPGQAVADTTSAHLEQFAATGLRTLCCAQVKLDEAAYERWAVDFHAASTAIVDRDAKLDAAAEAIEVNLELVGATAIEDRLQDGVPEAIATLARAGIQIWVLTGDKQETAINIAHSCRLFTDEMELIVFNEDTKQGAAARLAELNARHAPAGKRDDLALVVDGGTLLHALETDLELSFLSLGKLCKAVVACRVSPAQKAEVVNLVRTNEKAISLAIGDGANDVSMIQAAHVGIGISGEEGLQVSWGKRCWDSIVDSPRSFCRRLVRLIMRLLSLDFLCLYF